MKIPVYNVFVAALLLLMAVNTSAQTTFYPLHNGDTWVYWEFDQYGGVWDTITVRVVGDSTIAGRSYKSLSNRSWRNNLAWSKFERVDSFGDAFTASPTTGHDDLSYRLSDTSRTWWQANGYLQRFDSCVVKEMFGHPRAVMYVGAYRPQDTVIVSQRILVDSIGFFTWRFIGTNDGGSTTLHHGWINGVLFGTDPFAPPLFNFPLHAGDRWFYMEAPYPPNPLSYFYRYVARDTIMPNGRTYADIVTEKQGGQEFYRQSGDSVWMYDLGLRNEYLYLNFSRGSGDTVSSFPSVHDTTDITVRSTDMQTIFGALRRIWIVYVNPLRHGVDDEYSLTVADSLGIIRRDPDFGDFYTLIGAVINGRVYGTVDDISFNRSLIPTEFTLSQNYPNPFNPSTNIQYTLPHHAHVTLTVFNTLGQKVTELVNSEIEPGTHEVKFDGSRLASGVYFYRMQAGEYVQTKQLLLLK